MNLPDGLDLVRVTPEFDEQTVPAGLLAAHQVADGVWGRLVVKEGSLDFAFEDRPGTVLSVARDEAVVIPPARPHHVTVTGPVRFVVEFHAAR